MTIKIFIGFLFGMAAVIFSILITFLIKDALVMITASALIGMLAGGLYATYLCQELGTTKK